MRNDENRFSRKNTFDNKNNFRSTGKNEKKNISGFSYFFSTVSLSVFETMFALKREGII